MALLAAALVVAADVPARRPAGRDERSADAHTAGAGRRWEREREDAVA